MGIPTGLKFVSCDDKGRISIPSHFREALPGNTLIITKGLKECLWLFPVEEWTSFKTQMKSEMEPFSLPQRDQIQHRFLIPAQELEIDKLGRVAVPESLRDFAKLGKECVVASNGERMEIWDNRAYDDYQAEIEENLESLIEKMKL
ncbi:MAG: division/cell wall cluster transcriptional repressor MraZ [Treponema sp.]|jgi:MraZ protein|nr:division/cell wall cluster transcriptional repressor MraZ [Treponema sp.]